MGAVPFRDRADAGRRLAASLERYRGRSDLLIVALSPGGVPVGFEVAQALRAPLDVIAVGRLVAPADTEVAALGAVASSGVAIVDPDICEEVGLPGVVVREMIARETAELGRRARLYHEHCRHLEARDRTVILVDDGMMTGFAMRVAIRTMERSYPKSVIVGVPVAAFATCADLSTRVDELVYCEVCASPSGIAGSYDDYSPVSDDDVCRLLLTARASSSRRPAAA